MSIMIETLERISKYCHLDESFKSREEVEKQLSFFSFNLSDEVYEYYQWAGAPTGDCKPKQKSFDPAFCYMTYSCILERFLGTASDLIHFMSLEEAQEFYPNYSTYPDLYNLNCLPFVSYENGMLVIAGSENKIDVSPVLIREGGDKLWFPSLTNMMLAIAESIETIGTLLPGCTIDENGNYPSREEDERQGKIWREIAKKYGSPRGAILTN